jgi:hypothetical protein
MSSIPEKTSEVLSPRKLINVRHATPMEIREEDVTIKPWSGENHIKPVNLTDTMPKNPPSQRNSNN